VNGYNSNPAGKPLISKPTIKHPSRDTVAKQDPRHTEGEFLRDLKKATQQK
jgi:hypothetical protein